MPIKYRHSGGIGTFCPFPVGACYVSEYNIAPGGIFPGTSWSLLASAKAGSRIVYIYKRTG